MIDASLRIARVAVESKINSCRFWPTIRFLRKSSFSGRQNRATSSQCVSQVTRLSASLRWRSEEPSLESAPEAQVESETPSEDRAEGERASAKDDKDDPRASQTEELKDAAVATARLARFQGAWQRIEPVAIPVLRRVNYPLRHVPQKLRPIVDWIALSLLFWVPIVWVIALLAG